MIGNDIIDISEAKRIIHKSAVGWQRPGFLGKIFTQGEQLVISNSVDQFTMVWRLWSMKESAYKIYIQSGGERFYNPKKFECNIENSILGEVSFKGSTLKTTTSITSDYIFSTAILGKNDFETSIFLLPEKDAKQQSKFTHQKLLIDFAEKHSLELRELQINKTDAGVPQLHYKERPLSNSISITHHGKYGAYSVQEI